TGVNSTDDSAKYNAMPIGAKVVGIWDGAKLIPSTHGAEAAEQGVAVILDKTNFYAEMGGQVGDTGELRADKALMDVTATRVAEAVAKRLPVYAEEAPQEQALKINGLRAVFGEKYPPMVRVVSVGAPVKELLANPGDARWRGYSVEFCGGTHLKNAGDVGG